MPIGVDALLRTVAFEVGVPAVLSDEVLRAGDMHRHPRTGMGGPAGAGNPGIHAPLPNRAGRVGDGVRTGAAHRLGRPVEVFENEDIFAPRRKLILGPWICRSADELTGADPDQQSDLWWKVHVSPWDADTRGRV